MGYAYIGRQFYASMQFTFISVIKRTFCKQYSAIDIPDIDVECSSNKRFSDTRASAAPNKLPQLGDQNRFFT